MNKIYVNFIRLLSQNGIHKSNSSATVLCRYLSFKSDLSLDKIYPTSRMDIHTPSPPSNDGDKFSGYIPINKLEITYSRSSGPGGQNVNTVNTKVDVRFKLSEASWIPEKIREKLLNGLQSKLTKEGFYAVKSDLTRSQHMNLADALEKIRTLIRNYEIEPQTPSKDTMEMLRRRREKAARQRLITKRHRSQLKMDRQANGTDMFE